MNMVIRWKKTYIPTSVFEVNSFTEASAVVEKTMVEFGTSALDINLFEDHKLVASLRTVR